MRLEFQVFSNSADISLIPENEEDVTRLKELLKSRERFMRIYETEPKKMTYNLIVKRIEERLGVVLNFY